MRVSGSPAALRVKCLGDTPEFQVQSPGREAAGTDTRPHTPTAQEVRRRLGALHVDSRRKGEQDEATQGALDALFAQVTALREGLSILSSAFMEETGRQNKRIVELERELSEAHERQEDSTAAWSRQCG